MLLTLVLKTLKFILQQIFNHTPVRAPITLITAVMIIIVSRLPNIAISHRINPLCSFGCYHYAEMLSGIGGSPPSRFPAGWPRMVVQLVLRALLNVCLHVDQFNLCMKNMVIR